jgi:hypothetical protein
MKVLKQILCMAILTVGLSLTAMAQQDDKKNRPPKQDTPSIPAPDKNRPPDKPRDDNKDNSNRPKKPGEMAFINGKRIEINLV